MLKHRRNKIRHSYNTEISTMDLIDLCYKYMVNMAIKNDKSKEEAIKYYPHDYDKIELEYKNLDIVLCGPQLDVDCWDVK